MGVEEGCKPSAQAVQFDSGTRLQGEPVYELKKVTFDGKEMLKLRCPKCKSWGHLDDDQAHGRVSTLCECGFHETVDFAKEFEKD